MREAVDELTGRDEYGRIVHESAADSHGWVSIEAARKAVADFDRWAAETPRRFDPDTARLAIGPVVDRHNQVRPVGWYIDLTPQEQ